MDLSDIVSVAGMPGLYKISGQRSNGVIVKNIEDGASKFITSRMHSISPLENITIYVMDAEGSRELGVIFEAIKTVAEKTEIPDTKSDKKILAEFFKKAVPDYDVEQVYPSDIKKMIKWYILLDKHGLLVEKTAEEKDENSEEE